MRGITSKIWEKFGIFSGIFGEKGWYFWYKIFKSLVFFENLDLVTLASRGSEVDRRPVKY